MEQLNRGLSAVNTVLQKLEILLGSVALGVLFLVMTVNAGMRYLFDSGLNWSDEFNGFLFVWFGFLAAAYAMSTDSHLRITAIMDMLPKTVQYAVNMVMDVIMIVMFALYMQPLFSLMDTLPISNVMRWPMGYVYIILPLSFGLMCVHIVINMVRSTVTLLQDRKAGKGGAEG